MHNKQIAERIKDRCKSNGVSISLLLAECAINKNFIYDLEHCNKSPSGDKLTRIADYLDCSVDYLLCRTDNPHLASEVYIGGNNNGVQAVKNGSVTVHQNATDKFNEQILELLDSLTLEQKAEAILMITKMKGDS